MTILPKSTLSLVPPDPAWWDLTPHPMVAEDFSALENFFGPLRAAGVTDFVRHAREHPGVLRELLAHVRVVDANRAALTSAGCETREQFAADFLGLERAPFPAIFAYQLASAWDGRHAIENEYTWIDDGGQQRTWWMTCTWLDRATASGGATVILTWQDITTATAVAGSQLESQAALKEIFARANLLVWWAKVRRENGRFRWKVTVPRPSLSSSLVHLATALDKGGLWDGRETPDAAAMQELAEAALTDGETGYQHEFRVVAAERTYWLHEDVAVHHLSTNEWNLVGVICDVTQRHEAEQEQQRAAAHLKQILDRVDCMIWQAAVVEKEGLFHWVFDLAASGLQRRLFAGRRPFRTDGVTGKDDSPLYGGYPVLEQVEIDALSTGAMRRGDAGYDQEFRVQLPDQICWMHESVRIIPVGPYQWDLVGMVFDVTAQRAAERERQATEARLRQLLQRADCLIWEARVRESPGGEFTWSFFTPASRLYQQVFGCDPRAENPLMWNSVAIPELAEMHARSAHALHHRLPGYAQEFHVVTDRQTLWLREHVTIAAAAAGVWDLVGVVTDVTSLRAAESALGAEKERLAVTLRAMDEGVVTTDRNGMVDFINRAAETLTGCSNHTVARRPLHEVCSLFDARSGAPYELPLDQVLAEGAMIDLPPHTMLRGREERTCLVAGRVAPLRDATSVIIGAIMVFRDITERQRLDEQMQRASKLESVGILAGGIAHDFNNILTAILGNISLALFEAAPESTLRQSLDDAHDATLRARDLTHQLLTFAKGGDPVRVAVRLSDIVTEVARFALRGSSVGCEFDLPSDLWSANADKGQLAQIVQNLVINAVQAMPDGGVIHIRARNEVVLAGGPRPLVPGSYIALAVEDSGVGIEPQNLERIFDPYFTTKQQGHGLGLATVYSIMQRHQGHVEVASTPGLGTTFSLWLPAVRERGGDPSSERPTSVQTLHGRVLFMDDEAPIRKLGASAMRRLGLEVEVAADGAEAIRLFLEARAAGQPFDVLVMDLTVPGGMGGREALEELRKLGEPIRAIVSSGYSNDPVLANFRTYGFCGMVAKPYEFDQFALTLREALNQ